MTRDRKKLFISSVEKTISELEQNNNKMRDILAKQAIQYSASTPLVESSDSSKNVTPEPSPMLLSSDALNAAVPPLTTSLIETKTEDGEKCLTGNAAPLSVIA